LFCWINYYLRTPDNHLPYTITILPDVCTPWGRYKNQTIISCIQQLIESCGSTFKALNGIALGLGENADYRTILRYHRRAEVRIPSWNQELSTFLTRNLDKPLHHSQEPLCTSAFEAQWQHFKTLVGAIAERMAELPNTKSPTESYGFCLAIIGLHTKALGP
jgi:hypothetical protein